MIPVSSHVSACAKSTTVSWGEIASLVLVVLQAALSHAAIIFLDRTEVVVVDLRTLATPSDMYLPVFEAHHFLSSQWPPRLASAAQLW